MIYGVESYQPGDLVLCHSATLIGHAIRFAELRLANSEFSEWNHVAVLDRFENGKWYVIQAEAKGVTKDKTLDSIAPGGRYQVIPLPPQVDREKVLFFVRTQVGDRYSWFSIVSAAADMVTPDAICFRHGSTWICSGLVAAALLYGGLEALVDSNDIYSETPAAIAQLCCAVQ